MPTYSSDSSDSSAPRYGPAGFAAMVANMFVLEFITWVLMPAWYLLPVVVLPVVIVNALVAYGMTRMRSATAQVGRGMLIACASAPLTAVVFFLAVALAKAAGPL